MLDIVQLFFAIFLLFSYCIVGPMSMCVCVYIYISPICNAVAFLFFSIIIKIRNSSFSLFSVDMS